MVDPRGCGHCSSRDSPIVLLRLLPILVPPAYGRTVGGRAVLQERLVIHADAVTGGFLPSAVPGGQSTLPAAASQCARCCERQSQDSCHVTAPNCLTLPDRKRLLKEQSHKDRPWYLLLCGIGQHERVKVWAVDNTRGEVVQWGDIMGEAFCMKEHVPQINKPPGNTGIFRFLHLQ